MTIASLDQPPHYREAVETNSGDQAFGQDTQQKSEQYRSDELYPENRFGELGRTDSNSDMVQSSQTPNQQTKPVQDDSELYAENRFGELGRRDTEFNNSASLKDKLKGRLCACFILIFHMRVLFQVRLSKLLGS